MSFTGFGKFNGLGVNELSDDNRLLSDSQAWFIARGGLEEGTIDEEAKTTTPSRKPPIIQPRHTINVFDVTDENAYEGVRDTVTGPTGIPVYSTTATKEKSEGILKPVLIGGGLILGLIILASLGNKS